LRQCYSAADVAPETSLRLPFEARRCEVPPLRTTLYTNDRRYNLCICGLGPRMFLQTTSLRGRLVRYDVPPVHSPIRVRTSCLRRQFVSGSKSDSVGFRKTGMKKGQRKGNAGTSTKIDREIQTVSRNNLHSIWGIQAMTEGDAGSSHQNEGIHTRSSNNKHIHESCSMRRAMQKTNF